MSNVVAKMATSIMGVGIHNTIVNQIDSHGTGGRHFIHIRPLVLARATGCIFCNYKFLARNIPAERGAVFQAHNKQTNVWTRKMQDNRNRK